MRGKRESDEAGTIMIDALVAVAVISLMIAVCVQSLNLSHRLAADTRQIRQARQVMAAVAEVVPRVPGQYSGRRDGLAYHATVVADGDGGLCHIDIEAAGRRVYRLVATRWCRSAGAA